MVNSSIFKSYDVRGIYPADLNEDVAYLIGRAFARRLGVDEVVVGRDMRLSGEALKAEFVRGILDEGVNVVDIGLVPIDAVYFCVHSLGYKGAAMVTASHNPKEYNGFKMADGDMNMIPGESLYDDVIALQNESTAKERGVVSEKNVYTEFIEHLLGFADLTAIKPLKVVVDAGNGMATNVIPLLEKHLPVNIIPLNFKLDGNFPAHPSNPLLPESQKMAKEAVVEHQADCGVIFDGDTDRLFFIDEQGEFILADLTLLVLAKEFLQREPGSGVAYNVICSKVVPEKISEWGGVPIRTKVGFVNVARGMRENNGIMGGELSAHYSFRDNGYADSGFIALLIMLELISKDGRQLSEIVQEFKKYHKAEEINVEIEDRLGAVAAIKERYSDGKQDELDGLTVEYDAWWFNVRPSNTEPYLRTNIEADTQELLEEKVAELKQFITNL